MPESPSSWGAKPFESPSEWGAKAVESPSTQAVDSDILQAEDEYLSTDEPPGIRPETFRRAKRAGLVREQAELRAQPEPTTAGEFMDVASEPFVKLPRPKVEADDWRATQFLKGVADVGIGAVETVESPIGASVMAASFLPVVGPAVARTAGAGFGVASTWQGFKHAADAWNRGDAAEAGRAFGSLLLGGAMMHGAVKRSKAPTTKIEAAPVEAVKPSLLPQTATAVETLRESAKEPTAPVTAVEPVSLPVERGPATTADVLGQPPVLEVKAEAPKAAAVEPTTATGAIAVTPDDIALAKQIYGETTAQVDKRSTKQLRSLEKKMRETPQSWEFLDDSQHLYNLVADSLEKRGELPDTPTAATGATAPERVQNKESIPTAEESARWDALSAHQKPIIDALEGDALDAFAAKLDVKRRGQSDAKLKEQIVNNTHPDDIQDAIETQPATPASTGATAPPVEPPSSGIEPGLSSGPGAASPFEFSQRAKSTADVPAIVEGKVPPGDNAPVPLPDKAPLDTTTVRQNRDYHVFNRLNSGQWNFYFGRLGEAAKSAWERMALGEFRMRENIGKDVKAIVEEPLVALPRDLRKQGGKEFFKLLDGQTPAQIEASLASHPKAEVIMVQVNKVKGRLEEVRTTIRDTKRESYEASLNNLDRGALEELFKSEINPSVDTSRYTKSSFAEALSRMEFPDDWGIADGSYLPHLFFGDWKVSLTLPGAEKTSFVTRARTVAEAKAKIRELVRGNPDYAKASFTVDSTPMITPDMIRLGDRNFWRMIGRMKESLTEEAGAQINSAVKGIVGRKSTKTKAWGSLQERTGARGYEENYAQAATAYFNGFHRWLELSKMQRETAPLIDKVKAEGREQAAGELENIMDFLWGKPTALTKQVDNYVRSIPGARDYIKPLALSRWSRNLRSLTGALTLRTARFALLNRLQPLQGLYPLVGGKAMIEAKKTQHSTEGRALLDEAGIRFDPGQYADVHAAPKLGDALERMSGERSNQELAFLAMYKLGTDQGMAKPEAVRYAKLRGQLMTQFTPLIADTPGAFRGPVGELAFQYKRFPVKTLELIARMGLDGNAPGLVRLASVMALMGGASFYLRQVGTSKESQLHLQRALKDEVGEDLADLFYHGLPGYMGADFAGSLVLGDEPYGPDFYSKVARQVTGPAVSLAVSAATRAKTSRREDVSTYDEAVDALRTIPTLKPLAALSDLLTGETDVRTADGETKAHQTISDVLMSLGSFRSVNQSKIALATSAMIEIQKDVSSLKNDYYVSSLRGDMTEVEDAIEKFNARWPEAAIKQSELLDYVKTRARNAEKTSVEKTAGSKLKELLPTTP